MLALNYTGDNHTMYFILPSYNTDLSYFEQKILQPGSLIELREKLASRETIVTLPKFRVGKIILRFGFPVEHTVISVISALFHFQARQKHLCDVISYAMVFCKRKFAFAFIK